MSYSDYENNDFDDENIDNTSYYEDDITFDDLYEFVSTDASMKKSLEVLTRLDDYILSRGLEMLTKNERLMNLMDLINTTDISDK